jgi:type II secretory pathway pseudopilin PulG
MSIIEIRKKYIQSNSGTTLVELVVAMTLTAILATAVVSIMAPASRIFTQVKDLSRAQMTADLVVEALRQECADTYIEDFASVRIVNTAPSVAGDEDLLESLIEITSPSETEGNVLIIRKNGGYCEAIYSCLAISPDNYQAIKDDDQAIYKYENGISSKAVYRLFEGSNGYDDTLQGYVHYGYYQCGRSTLETVHNGETKHISCIFPGERFDYTNPFTLGAYNGYTVSLNFSELSYGLGPGEMFDDIYTKRPESVKVTVSVYKCDYEAQNSERAVYTRTATLVFAEDTTTK